VRRRTEVQSRGVRQFWAMVLAGQRTACYYCAMRPACHTSTKMTLVILASVIGVGVPAAAQQDRRAGRVELVGPFDRAAVPDTSSTLGYKFADLAKIDPEHPLADDAATQTLILFGREDLIAGSSSNYKSNRCAPLSTPTKAFTAIRDKARTTSIVIINESHERSEHRGFISEVARELRPLGYDTLAIETLSNSPPGTPERYQPTFLRQPGLPYLVDQDGFYLSEAGFGRLGRAAKRLGYHLIGYEPNEDGPPRQLSREEQIAVREEGQARNLASFLTDHPASKLLIHVGYSHAAEVPQADGVIWMAARLKQKTGIDPLTIDQTKCRGGGDTLRLSAVAVTRFGYPRCRRTCRRAPSTWSSIIHQHASCDTDPYGDRWPATRL
jgi:hypothetical protein